MGLEQDIEKFLLQNRQVNSRDFVLQQTARVTMLAELHVGKPAKARFLASVIQGAAGTTQPRFHASEHFLAEPKHRIEIQNYVYSSSSSKPSGNRLPSLVLPFQPVLEAARTFPGHAYAILAGGSSASSGRDQAIFNAFTDSIQRHNTLFPGQQITTSTRGNFLIGAAHGARINFKTATPPTTTALLRQNGFSLSVIRFVVDVLGSSSVDDGGATIVGGESVVVEPLSGSGSIDVLPILRKVANGSMFHAVITGPSSPFSKVKEENGRTIPYNQLYDSILYLPG